MTIMREERAQDAHDLDNVTYNLAVVVALLLLSAFVFIFVVWFIHCQIIVLVELFCLFQELFVLFPHGVTFPIVVYLASSAKIVVFFLFSSWMGGSWSAAPEDLQFLLSSLPTVGGTQTQRPRPDRRSPTRSARESLRYA